MCIVHSIRKEPFIQFLSLFLPSFLPSFCPSAFPPFCPSFHPSTQQNEEPPKIPCAHSPKLWIHWGLRLGRGSGFWPAVQGSVGGPGSSPGGHRSKRQRQKDEYQSAAVGDRLPLPCWPWRWKGPWTRECGKLPGGENAEGLQSLQGTCPSPCLDTSPERPIFVFVASPTTRR